MGVVFNPAQQFYGKDSGLHIWNEVRYLLWLSTWDLGQQKLRTHSRNGLFVFPESTDVICQVCQVKRLKMWRRNLLWDAVNRRKNKSRRDGGPGVSAYKGSDMCDHCQLESLTPEIWEVIWETKSKRKSDICTPKVLFYKVLISILEVGRINQKSISKHTTSVLSGNLFTS